MQPPIDHTFSVNGSTYHLVEPDSGGLLRIQTEYAIAMAPLEQSSGGMPRPDSTAGQVGPVLYARALARECLTAAPDGFDVDHVRREDWEPFLEGVFAFLGKLFPGIQPAAEGPASAVPAEPPDVAPVEIVPAAFAGRAG